MTDYSIIDMLARFWGGVGLVFALLLLIKRDFMVFLIKEFDHLGALSASMGVLSIIIGVASLAIYSHWSFDWRLIITFYGWAALIKGVRILVMPRAFNAIIRNEKFLAYSQIALIVLGVVSLFLLFKGF